MPGKLTSEQYLSELEKVEQDEGLFEPGEISEAERLAALAPAPKTRKDGEVVGSPKKRARPLTNVPPSLQGRIPKRHQQGSDHQRQRPETAQAPRGQEEDRGRVGSDSRGAHRGRGSDETLRAESVVAPC